MYFNHFTSVQNKMDFYLIRRLNVLGDLSIRNQCDKKKFLNAISTIFSIFFFSRSFPSSDLITVVSYLYAMTEEYGQWHTFHWLLILHRILRWLYDLPGEHCSTEWQTKVGQPSSLSSPFRYHVTVVLWIYIPHSSAIKF